jgi:hypothetical protein
MSSKDSSLQMLYHFQQSVCLLFWAVDWTDRPFIEHSSFS